MENLNTIEQKAREFAKSFHKDHLRINGDNYFIHLENVVNELHSLKITDNNILALAYLHHIPDFDPNYLTTIQTEFGTEIVDLIASYNRLASIDIPNVKPNHINEKVIIQTFMNLVQDPRLLILRVVDKAENIKTAHLLDHDKSIEIAHKALYIYSPICRLTGLFKYVRVFEDNAFKILNPAEYFLISSYLKNKERLLVNNLTEAKKIISEILIAKGVNNDIWYRVKNAYSIFVKAQRKKLDITLTNLALIKDIAAMRILVDTEEECYTAEDILNQLFDSYPEKRKDYILIPKPSGYKSIHNLYKLSNDVDVEIQIKTHEMHEFNETGAGSHAFYKLGKELEKKLAANPNALIEINYYAGDTFKIDHFSNNVYVFTPLGDILEFPKGANLIDYAYAIHDDIGNSCVGGVVNGQMQKLTYELKNGDRVEIKTSSGRKNPNMDWLKIVKTRHAKSSIRKALKGVL